MEIRRAKELLNKFREGKSTEAENALLDSWYLTYRENAPVELTAQDYQLAELLMYSKLPDAATTKRISLWPRYRIALCAAAAFVVMTLFVWFYLPEPVLLPNSTSVYQNDIEPGKHMATIVLTDGKTIRLSDAKRGVIIGTDLRYSDGSTVGAFIGSAGKAGMITVSAPRGGTYEVVLPDSTKVWLNAGSKISFTSQFIGATRMISLSGEAYFEVSKNKNKPFIVEAGGNGDAPAQQIEVLGTHFNVSAYQDEALVKTTLLEGSVKVSIDRLLQDDGRKSTKVLRPGQQAVTTRHYLKILPVDTEVAIAWKNGNFMFREEQLSSIMKKLAYWYDVNVVYKGKEPALKISGVISRKRKLSAVLTMLELAGNVSFEIEGRTVYVK